MKSPHKLRNPVIEVLEDPNEDNKPRGPIMEALEDLWGVVSLGVQKWRPKKTLIRVMKYKAITNTTKLYHSDAKRKN